MKIDRHNYEVYIVDYFDGRLSDHETALLLSFLNENPDLYEEFEAFEDLKVPFTEHITFSGKQDLKKTITSAGKHIDENNFEEKFFEDVEGNLDAASHEELEHFLELNPSLKRDYELMKKTRLTAPAVVFPGKAALKKAIVLPLYRSIIYVTSAAAVIALLITAGLIYLQRPGIPGARNLGIAQQSDLRQNGTIITPQNPQIQEALNLTADVNTQPKLTSGPAGEKQVAVVDQPIIQRMNIKTINELPLQQTPNSGLADHYQTGGIELLAALESRQKMQNANAQPEGSPTIWQRLFTSAKRISEKQNVSSPDDRFTIWDVAAVSVSGYNALARNDLVFKRSTNEDGKTTTLALGRIEYSRKK